METATTQEGYLKPLSEPTTAAPAHYSRRTAVMEAIEDIVYGSVRGPPPYTPLFRSSSRHVSNTSGSRLPVSSASTSNTRLTRSRCGSSLSPTTSRSSTAARSTASASPSGPTASSGSTGASVPLWSAPRWRTAASSSGNASGAPSCTPRATRRATSRSRSRRSGRRAPSRAP